jgi:hypothetical protein
MIRHGRGGDHVPCRKAIKGARGEDMATRRMRLSIAQRYHIKVAGAVAASGLGGFPDGSNGQDLAAAEQGGKRNRWWLAAFQHLKSRGAIA